MASVSRVLLPTRFALLSRRAAEYAKLLVPVLDARLHVVHVAEIEPESQQPLSEVEEQIRSRLGAERFEMRTREFLDEQAALAYVVENLPDDAVGYRTAATGTTDPLRALLEGDAPAAEDAPPAAEVVAPEVVEPAPEPPASSN